MPPLKRVAKAGGKLVKVATKAAVASSTNKRVTNRQGKREERKVPKNSQVGKVATVSRGLYGDAGKVDTYGSEVVPSKTYSSRTLPVNSDNLVRVINTIVQAHIAGMNQIQLQDANANLVALAASAMYADLLGATYGEKSRFTEATEFYKDIFDAISPKDITGIKYSGRAGGVPLAYYEVDDFKIGEINPGAYGDTGLGIVTSPFVVGPDGSAWTAAAVAMFSNFGAAGHKMVTMSTYNSYYMNDPSAFCSITTKVADAQNTMLLASLEVPITAVWAASMGIFSSSDPAINRVPNYTVTLYGPGHSYVGSRITQFKVGPAGRMDQIRLTRVDVYDLLAMSFGTITGATEVWEADNETGTNPWLNPDFSNNSLWIIYTQLLASGYFLPYSPVTHSIRDPFAVFYPVPWGMQFLPNDPGTLAGWLYPMVIVENLRMLRPYTRKIRGVVTSVYPVPSYSTKGWEGYQVRGWTDSTSPDNPFSNTYNFDRSFDRETFVSLTPLGINTTLASVFGYIEAFNFAATDLQRNLEFNTCAVSSNMTKKTTLTHMTRVVYAPLGAALPGKKRVEEVKVDRFRQNLVEGNKFRAPMPKLASTTVKSDVALPLAIMCDRPILSSYAIFYQLCIPLAMAVFENGSTLEESISQQFDRLACRAYVPTNSVGNPYKDAIYIAGRKAASAVYVDSAKNELMQVFSNDAEMGLGGAIGSGVGWFLTKVFGKNAGDTGKAFTNKVVDKYRDRL